MLSIPETLKPFFQEHNFELLDPVRDGEVIIERSLLHGNRDEVRWLLHQYGQVRIKQWISTTGLRRLSRRRYHLWCVLLNVTFLTRQTKLHSKNVLNIINFVSDAKNIRPCVSDFLESYLAFIS